jgi:hypothetical protein
VWVIDKLEHGLVLGRTYRKAAGLKLDEMDDGSCGATTFTPDRTAMVWWQAVSRNQSKEDLLSKHTLKLSSRSLVGGISAQQAWGGFKSGMKGHVGVDVESDVRAKRAGSERGRGLYRTKSIVRQSRIGLNVGLDVRPVGETHVFPSLPWSAYISEGLGSRVLRRFDVGRVDTSCIARVSTLYNGRKRFWNRKKKSWRQDAGEVRQWLTPRFTDAPVGSRLTSDRMASISVGGELTLWGKKLFFAYLLNREMAEKFRQYL